MTFIIEMYVSKSIDSVGIIRQYDKDTATENKQENMI
jgi:hypothetical protein